jgi:hypothetical protein
VPRRKPEVYQFTPESLAKAFESFQAAIALDPNYALPHVGIADFHNWGNIYGLIPSLIAQTEAERAARFDSAKPDGLDGSRKNQTAQYRTQSKLSIRARIVGIASDRDRMHGRRRKRNAPRRKPRPAFSANENARTNQQSARRTI